MNGLQCPDFIDLPKHNIYNVSKIKTSVESSFVRKSMNKPIDKISPFIVMDVLSKARKIPDAIHMEVGEPDIPPSQKVMEAYVRAIKDKKFHYTPAKGLPELREKIAEYYQYKYNVKITPERIIITPGTSGAFMVVFSLLTDKDRRLALADPSYPCYKNFAYFLGTEPLMIPAGKDSNYKISRDKLESSNNIGAMVISSPSNPVGNTYDEKSLKELVHFSLERRVWFISDEIYHGLVYNAPEHSSIEYSDRVVVINGFSKYFCMPGFRVGWMILPEGLVRKAEIIIQNIFIAANTPAQYAAIEAFDYNHLENVRNTFKGRRDFLYHELKDILSVDSMPDGAFYIWADVSRYSNDAVKFCRELLDKKAVAITPGIDFGRNDTNHYVRFAYTQEMSKLKTGIERIKEFLK